MMSVREEYVLPLSGWRRRDLAPGQATKILDLVVAGLTFLSVWLLARMWITPELGRDDPMGGFPLVLLILLLCCSFSCQLFGAYAAPARRYLGKAFLALIKGLVGGTTLALLILHLLDALQGIQLAVALFILFAPLSLLAGRAAIVVRRRVMDSRREVLIIGSRERARELIQVLLAPESSCNIIGCLDYQADRVGTKVAGDVSVIGTLQEFRAVLYGRAVDEVIFAMPLRKIDNVLHYIRFAEKQGVAIRVLPDWQLQKVMYRPDVASVYIEQIGGIPTVALSSAPNPDLALLVKGILDRTVAMAGLFFLAPLFALIALAIRLNGPGPIFFRQQRCGLNGRVFPLYKFRTMVQDAEQLKDQLKEVNEVDGPVFKMRHDPRITGIGRYLRRFSLDELPQLINIVRGEMSLVGPRPPLPSEVREYEHWQRRRLSMKPGLTCIWQVSGRNDVGFAEWMRMDLQYIDNWSLRLDGKLLLKTVPTVLFGTGR
jgi:exopolysaccharide biosynthesis polyprenyl glycosylphosphotransferase